MGDGWQLCPAQLPARARQSHFTTAAEAKPSMCGLCWQARGAPGHPPGNTSCTPPTPFQGSHPSAQLPCLAGERGAVPGERQGGHKVQAAAARPAASPLAAARPAGRRAGRRLARRRDPVQTPAAAPTAGGGGGAAPGAWGCRCGPCRQSQQWRWCAQRGAGRRCGALWRQLSTHCCERRVGGCKLPGAPRAQLQHGCSGTQLRRDCGPRLCCRAPGPPLPGRLTWPARAASIYGAQRQPAGHGSWGQGQPGTGGEV